MHHLYRVSGEARGPWLICFCLRFDGISSNAEDDLFSSGEDGEHNVDSFMRCSSAHHACSPFLQGFLHEEDLMCGGSDTSLLLGCGLLLPGLSA